jgi:DNA-binding NarL/FixJ family response regulator
MSIRADAGASGGRSPVLSSTKDRPSVVIAEDSSLMSARLQMLLAPDCDLLASVLNGRDLVHAVRTHRPDVIVSDIDMPVMTGLEAARIILQEEPNARIAFVTALLDPAIIKAALSLGVLAFVVKRDAGRELISAVRSCVDGKIYVSTSGWNALGQTVGQGTGWNDNEQ